jgi:hypothetical protein
VGVVSAARTSMASRRVYHVSTDVSSLVAPKAFNYLPLGEIKPTGWLYNQVGVDHFERTRIDKILYVAHGPNKWLGWQ